ncbi:MAG: FixH family protein [Planctomycetaceae bacterium]|nr:FixH family protein [Planctomycetaceae bacterium]MCB9953607.1 FixH family protein [Planctomycetaceae bacterium]
MNSLRIINKLGYGVCAVLCGFLSIISYGCQESTTPGMQVSATLDITPSPPTVGEADVVLTLTGAKGELLTGGEIEIEGNMDHAGMKPVFSKLTETAPGKYTGKLEFTMGGDWFVLVTGQLADGHQLNEKVDVPGVKSQ